MNERADLTATLSALQAARQEFSRDAQATLPSVRRIVTRIQHAALLAGRREIAYIAASILEAEAEGEVAALTDHLIQHLRMPRETESGPTPRVLMIEDDRLTARVLADALQASGCEVVIAGSAEEGQRRLAENEYDLILLDLVLPDADGRDLLVALRAQAPMRHVAILVVTARTDPQAHAECFALGANGVLAKPVHPDVLTSAVAAHVRHRSEQRQESRTDVLTGLPNRAGLFEAIQVALPVAWRQNQPVSVAMIDLDHFKSVNDTHGHQVGDEVLQRCGQVLSSSLRISDLVARIGGEEFCAFLPNTTLEGALVALDKARNAVRALRFKGAGDLPFTVTFSAGLTEIERDEPPHSAIARADRRLYLAKAGGRNRVVAVDDAGEIPAPRVMLVDDDDALARMVSTLLSREGLQPVRFNAGVPALNALKTDEFVLAILDLNLPDMTGFDLLREVRKQRSAAALPIVMLTGSTDERDLVRGFELGANDYVTKPFHASELIARVRHARGTR